MNTAQSAGERGKPWMRATLFLAGTYNLVWGTVVVLAPSLMFDLLSLPRPLYPGIWQCVGMIVGVYGIGYLIAARAPLRHWPIVLVGMLGKIFGPLGFVFAVSRGELPWSFGATIVTNDLIWWAPFAMILWQAFRFHSDVAGEPAQAIPPLAQLLETTRSHRGATLLDLSRDRPLMLIFLRHAGCTFCREAMSDLVRQRAHIEAAGLRLALVHMSSPLRAALFTARYGLEDLHRFADPQCRLYRALGLERGKWRQLFGLHVWRRAASAFIRGHGMGGLEGDGFRLPGVFVLSHGRVVAEYRHRTAADRPDYANLACDLVELDSAMSRGSAGDESAIAARA